MSILGTKHELTAEFVKRNLPQVGQGTNSFQLAIPLPSDSSITGDLGQSITHGPGSGYSIEQIQVRNPNFRTPAHGSSDTNWKCRTHCIGIVLPSQAWIVPHHCQPDKDFHRTGGNVNVGHSLIFHTDGDIDRRMSCRDGRQTEFVVTAQNRSSDIVGTDIERFVVIDTAQFSQCSRIRTADLIREGILQFLTSTVGRKPILFRF
mmetsp:Transcript_7949/g.19209  ORF Transcript_7949/g.19209 Transcript_7949/m.19209 type:complete len:205 (-) Transcript_7949:178-792(-)